MAEVTRITKQDISKQLAAATKPLNARHQVWDHGVDTDAIREAWKTVQAAGKTLMTLCDQFDAQPEAERKPTKSFALAVSVLVGTGMDQAKAEETVRAAQKAQKEEPKAEETPAAA